MRPADYIRPIFFYTGKKGDEYKFLGSAFGFETPNCLLTAKHVVNGFNLSDLFVLSKYPNKYIPIKKIHKHSHVDIALIKIEENPPYTPLYFKIFDDHIGLGAQIFSYGYPASNINTNKIKLESRSLTGYVQRIFNYEFKEYKYEACELSFPITGGFSGSPVLLQREGTKCIGVITHSYESETIVDYYEEHITSKNKEVHKISKVISYGLCVYLLRYKNWFKKFLS